MSGEPDLVAGAINCVNNGSVLRKLC